MAHSPLSVSAVTIETGQQHGKGEDCKKVDVKWEGCVWWRKMTKKKTQYIKQSHTCRWSLHHTQSHWDKQDKQANSSVLPLERCMKQGRLQSKEKLFFSLFLSENPMDFYEIHHSRHAESFCWKPQSLFYIVVQIFTKMSSVSRDGWNFPLW